MDSKPAGRKANLKQYRAVDGKWQFGRMAWAAHPYAWEHLAQIMAC